MNNETKVLELEQFRAMAGRIEKLSDLAMFSIQYAAGCREGELVNMHVEDAFKLDADRLWVRFRTLKNPRHPLRSVPISRKLDWLCEPIFRWLKIRRDVGNPMAWLFPSPANDKSHISTRYVRKKTVEYFGMRNHSFRHSRVTFYFRREGNAQKAIKLFGWSDGRPATDYTHLTTKDLEGCEEL